MKSTIRWTLACAVFLSACSNQPFTVDVPFRVTSVSPSPGGNGIARSAKLIVTFSEDIAPESVTNDAAFKVAIVGKNGVTPVAGTYAYESEDTYAASFKPAQPMPWGATIRLSLTTDIKRARDSAPLPTPISFEFQIQTPPALAVTNVTATPLDTPNAKIVATFSEPVKCESLDAVVITEIFDTGGESRTVDGSWDCGETPAPSDEYSCAQGGCTYRFTANSSPAFNWSSRIDVAFNDDSATGKVESARGAKLGELPNNGVFSVRMPNPPPFQLVHSAPAENAAGVEQKPVLHFTFTQKPTCRGITLPGAEVKSKGRTETQFSSVSGEWDCSRPCVDNECLVTFEPTGKFNLGDTVTTTFKAGDIKSENDNNAGGSLLSTVAVTFYIAEPQPLLLLSATPGASATGVSTTPEVTLEFSRAIKCDEPALVVCSDGSCAVSVNGSGAVWTKKDCTGSTLTLEPSTPLHLSTLVTIVLKTEGISAVDGGRLATVPPFSWRVRNPEPLQVVSTKATTSGATTTVEFEFDRNVNCQSPAPTLQLTPPVSGTPVQGCTGNSKMTFSSKEFTPAQQYVATAVEGIEASNAVELDGTVYGKLERDVSFTFEISGPLAVVAWSPEENTAHTTQSTPITLTFNENIDPTTVKFCPEAGCNVYVKRGIAKLDAILSLESVTAQTIKFNAPTTSPSSEYTIVVLSGAQGVKSASGKSLKTDFNMPFTTPSRVSAKLYPETGYDPLEVTSPVCVEFSDDVKIDSLEGNLTLVPSPVYRLDGKFLVSGIAGSGKTKNKVCLNVGYQDVGGVDLGLKYGQNYVLTVGSGVTFDSQMSLSSDKTLEFATELAPSVSSSVKYSNSVLTDEPLVAGAENVPYVASLEIDFGSAIDPNTVNTATVILTNVTDPNGPVRVEVNTHVATQVVSLSALENATLLEPGKQYTLEVVGGLRGVLLAGKKPMPETKTIAFTTRAQTTFSAQDDGDFLEKDVDFTRAANHPLHGDSVDGDSVYGTCYEVGYLGSHAGTSVVKFTPVATGGDKVGPCSFEITADVLDDIGNPVKPDTFIRSMNEQP